MDEADRVLIAGAGPVGLFCALLLGRAGIPVTILEATDELLDDPRAATTHPATLEVLDHAGIVQDMIREGLVAEIFQFWDRPSNSLVAEFDHTLLKDETRFPFVVQCEQFKTSKIIVSHLRMLSNVDLRMGHQVIEVSQGTDCVKVVARHEGDETAFVGSYLIGADGGRSTVRKACNIAFEGFTWEERFLVLTTPFDFEKNRGFCFRNYIADPDEWANCFKVAGDGPPGLWRIVFPADTSLSVEAIMSDDSVQDKMQRFFPKSGAYEIVHRNIYSIHQRVARSFRDRRVFLAGDSAHVNNSIGGMGLNGGLQDAANLSEKLIDVLQKGVPPAHLDLYTAQRRSVSIEFVQRQTIANKKRLEARDPDERRRNLDELRAIAADPARARDFLIQSSMLAMQRKAAMIVDPDAGNLPFTGLE